jgi:hypothetical protein
LVFPILLIIATAVLLGWLLFAIARFGLGDLRHPRLFPHHLLGVAPGAASSAHPAGAGSAVAPEPEPVAAADEPTGDAVERVLYDELDAELAVREHLYGSRSRRA